MTCLTVEMKERETLVSLSGPNESVPLRSIQFGSAIAVDSTSQMLGLPRLKVLDLYERVPISVDPGLIAPFEEQLDLAAREVAAEAVRLPPIRSGLALTLSVVQTERSVPGLGLELDRRIRDLVPGITEVGKLTDPVLLIPSRRAWPTVVFPVVTSAIVLAGWLRTHGHSGTHGQRPVSATLNRQRIAIAKVRTRDAVASVPKAVKTARQPSKSGDTVLRTATRSGQGTAVRQSHRTEHSAGQTHSELAVIPRRPDARSKADRQPRLQKSHLGASGVSSHARFVRSLVPQSAIQPWMPARSAEDGARSLFLPTAMPQSGGKRSSQPPISAPTVSEGRSRPRRAPGLSRIPTHRQVEAATPAEIRAGEGIDRSRTHLSTILALLSSRAGKSFVMEPGIDPELTVRLHGSRPDEQMRLAAVSAGMQTRNHRGTLYVGTAGWLDRVFPAPMALAILPASSGRQQASILDDRLVGQTIGDHFVVRGPADRVELVLRAAAASGRTVASAQVEEPIGIDAADAHDAPAALVIHGEANIVADALKEEVRRLRIGMDEPAHLARRSSAKGPIDIIEPEVDP